MRVECYKNLHKHQISVRECGKRVLSHESTVYIKDPQFVVQPAGRQRVIDEGRKNVHAFVRGELMGFTVGTLRDFLGWHDWRLASYNPFRSGSFFDKATGDEVHSATHAVVTTAGVYYRHA